MVTRRISDGRYIVSLQFYAEFGPSVVLGFSRSNVLAQYIRDGNHCCESQTGDWGVFVSGSSLRVFGGMLIRTCFISEWIRSQQRPHTESLKFCQYLPNFLTPRSIGPGDYGCKDYYAKSLARKEQLGGFSSKSYS